MATTGIDVHTPNAETTQIKGRRKLEFSESQRFKGKNFFLDLTGYRKTKELAAELTVRGASVEKFLDKRVRYLITNKPQTAINNAKANVTSNATTPSTGGLSQVFSPYSIGQSPYGTGQSPYLDKKTSPQPHYYTRSQKMLQMAREKESQTADILTLAARWNCKIIHVDAVVKELKKLKPLAKKKTNVEYTGPMPKYVRKLRKPFFKIEDLSCEYRPIVYETVKWPYPNYHSSHKVSPFAVNYNNEYNGNSKRDYGDEEMVCDDEKRSGFCEPCSVKYEDLKEHLNSDKHKSYAENEDNFAKLDELISQCTPLDAFLSESRRESRTSRSPNSPCHSPLVKLPHLSLSKVVSPVVASLVTKRTNRSSPESCDLVAKKTRLNL